MLVVLGIKEEAVLQCIMYRIIKTGRRYGIERNVRQNQGNVYVKECISITDYDGSETAEECVILQLFG